MKLLGVCIVYDNNNYGSMLQSYATQQKLNELGIMFEVIRYRKKKTPAFILKSLPRMFNPILISDKYLLIQKKIQLKRYPELSKLNQIRNEKFDEFRKKNFKYFSKVSYGYDKLKKDSLKYQAFLVGSDQLWSPSGLPTNFYNLIFAPNDKVKISYASSFGVKRIPSYQVKRTITYLKRIQFISVRENSGRKIVKDLIQRDVPVVVDPTLLFDEIGWKRLIPDQQKVKEPYIFAYFLGATASHREEVTRLGKELNMKIVSLHHMDQYVKADEDFGEIYPYDIGPEEFVNLIRHARYVCTDSFHGSVFSIIHQKQFVVFNRYSETAIDSKNTRIDSLLDNLDIGERRFKHNLKELMLQPIDYDKVNINLSAMRKKSEEYLNNALECMKE